MKIPKPLVFAGIGAGLMYLLDPQHGNRRRALIRDQIVHLQHVADDTWDARSEDVANRTRGLAAELKGKLAEENVSDEVLAERVRSTIGRSVSNPGSIEVSAHQGTITLSGPVLTKEATKLVTRVRTIRGVKDVVNRLETHEEAGAVSGLQTG